MADSNPISSHSQSQSPPQYPPQYQKDRSENDVVLRRSHQVQSHSMTHSTHATIDSGITTRRVTADEIAFRDGYVQGREQERRRQQHEQRRMQHVYAHQGMVGGLLTGILLTLTVGFVATMLAVTSPDWQTNNAGQTTSQPIR